MDETTANPPDAAPRRRAPLVVVIVLLLAAAAAAWWWYRVPHPDTAAQVAALQAQVDELNRALARVRGNADTFRARLDDGDKVDASVRQQLLALGQRVQLSEDAVANLADLRMSGHDALALDEAELLLTLGGERFTLFRDVPAAIAAYRAADTALAEVDDAAFSTVRQSIAGEIAALNDLHAADAFALATRLSNLRAQVAALPQAASLSPAPGDKKESAFARLFGAFVQVRQDADTAQAQGMVRDAALARDLLQLDLRAAQAAALARDDAGFRDALAQAHAQVLATFAVQAPPTVAFVRELDALATAQLSPAPPAVLGAALKDLRNLRATHALAAAKAASRHNEVKK
ncbi:MAG: uroporphyrinogen-III C-methyltransferase [Proteobacteria bacterium]|nr:uroporphyrinogen-III C-methyltransferase [Pseudomonadota bacterium]